MDAGGPFRETLTNVVEEVESENLPLTIKTPNQRNNHGTERDTFMLNPASQTPTHQELFVFMGYFLGFSIRTKSAMDWHFPSMFWKQLLGETVTMKDLEGVDAYTYQMLKDMRRNA